MLVYDVYRYDEVKHFAPADRANQVWHTCCLLSRITPRTHLSATFADFMVKASFTSVNQLCA